ncbi:SAM-dependent methyltransferase [Amycolatopsis sp. NPDC049252]|uniref:SAM-dependent methyltransferase n=1 Tax=Amycolatopsis sp. NPDC049252 TaxID=3363933 RepID=UPI003714FD44
MSHGQSAPFSDVADVYDQLSEFFTTILGGSIHLGYWAEGDTLGDNAMVAASERLTAMMIDKIAVGPGQRVLDVGCGTGQPALELVRATGADVLGITISGEQVATATELGRGSGLADRMSFQLTDVMELPFETGSFDAAWLFESLPHIRDRRRALEQVARVVRKGGLIALTDFVQIAPMTPEETEAATGLMESFHLGGFCSLERYPEVIREAGLEVVEVNDISANTIRSDDAFLDSFLTDLREKAAKFGAVAAEAIDSIEAVSRGLNDLHQIGYALIVARA